MLNGQSLIVNRLPLVREGKLIGAVSSFRRKDELAELSAQLSQVQAYSDLLRGADPRAQQPARDHRRPH